MSNFREMERDELLDLVSGVKGVGTPTWRGTYYMGSDLGFDYFVHKYGFHSKILIKVRNDGIALEARYPLSTHRKDWTDYSNHLLELAEKRRTGG